jgi:hypothetical protein
MVNPTAEAAAALELAENNLTELQQRLSAAEDAQVNAFLAFSALLQEEGLLSLPLCIKSGPWTLAATQAEEQTRACAAVFQTLLHQEWEADAAAVDAALAFCSLQPRAAPR